MKLPATLVHGGKAQEHLQQHLLLNLLLPI
jgi:hypothetical protein